MYDRLTPKAPTSSPTPAPIPRCKDFYRGYGCVAMDGPTSNTFIGSGLCDVAGLKAAGVPVGLATDVGGGSSFSSLFSRFSRDCAAEALRALARKVLIHFISRSMWPCWRSKATWTARSVSS